MTYQAFNETTIIDYIKTRPALAAILPPTGRITAKEVGDGNLNTVYILQNEENPGQALVIKQALPYLRILGEGWALTRERIRFETESLRLYNQYAPGLAPAIYDYDDEMSLVAMEY